MGHGGLEHIGYLYIVFDIAGDVYAPEAFHMRIAIEAFHLTVEPMPHQFQRDIGVAVDTGRLTLLGEVFEDLVNVGHVEVATQAKVLRPPVVAAQERMDILQAFLVGGGITQMSHEQLSVVGVIHTLENLRNGILSLCPLTKHILLTHRCVKIHTSHTSTFLTTVVLFLHHQVEFVQPIFPRAVFLLVILQRLQQANHRHATLMLQLFHRHRL